MGFMRFLFMILFGASFSLYAQNIPSNEIIGNKDLSNYLKEDVKEELTNNGAISNADLAQYFREKFSERYFYDWKNVASRFAMFKNLYPESESYHSDRALDHLSKFSAITPWVLPFTYLNGEPVNAYAIRHLARQHKMFDIALFYYYQNEDSKYITYFKNQLGSLNSALASGQYEKIEDGNGVYEVFRSGYRILNWLQIHNLFLGQENYSDEDQLTTIATLLQHGAHLYAHNTKFESGNHQTRGMSALAMLSILFRDFEGTDLWFERSMNLLQEHITNEINEDGFQFERTVHYHMSDIDTYFYVYQLAKNSDFSLDEFWKNKMESLFLTLVKIAYPDKSAPVLSDDTDIPWAEKNDIRGALTLGYILFQQEEMGYFANTKVEPWMYWFLGESQLNSLQNIRKKQPTYKSLSFPKTGYYVQREGWSEEDKMMIISAGLDDKKPDHQHGDMLGIQAMANEKVILPNYQVRYSLEDLELFKNSMVKNVALVDDALQGKEYKSNKGGSGFGKFGNLPQPKIIAWSTNDDLDIFVGSHDGFEDIGVNYSRQVIFIKNDFWIIKDNFKSDQEHNYKQVWQGHYSFENAPSVLRATFDNGSGCDIFQLQSVDTFLNSGARGKEWTVISKIKQKDFSFITVIFPFEKYEDRIDENKSVPKLKGWQLNNSKWKMEGTASVALTKDNQSLFFSVNELELNNLIFSFSRDIDIKVEQQDDDVVLESFCDKVIQVTIHHNNIKTTQKLMPGVAIVVHLKK